MQATALWLAANRTRPLIARSASQLSVSAGIWATKSRHAEQPAALQPRHIPVRQFQEDAAYEGPDHGDDLRQPRLGRTRRDAVNLHQQKGIGADCGCPQRLLVKLAAARPGQGFIADRGDDGRRRLGRNHGPGEREAVFQQRFFQASAVMDIDVAIGGAAE